MRSASMLACVAGAACAVEIFAQADQTMPLLVRALNGSPYRAAGFSPRAAAIVYDSSSAGCSTFAIAAQDTIEDVSFAPGPCQAGGTTW